MMIIIVLLLVLVGALILFALQNLSPVVLTFLGIKTLGLPLGGLILIAIAIGFCTSLIMAALFQLANYLSSQELRSRIRELEAENSDSKGQRYQSATASESSAYSSSDRGYNSPANSANNEEDEDEDEDASEPTPSYQNYTPNQTNYEREQEPPTTRYQSGSVYSYGYRNPSNSGVGRTESVYDAEYRIITPPYRGVDPTENSSGNAPRNPNKNNDDDWGFEDDDNDDFDDSDDRYS